MAMNPRTHPRGARPDFTLPRPNPNPSRMTDALWWLVCMRLLLEPGSQNGGTFADKPGSHNAGENLPNYGQGNSKTDHSIRDSFNRTGPWWREYTAAHDWTFPDAQRGDYKTINKYTGRLIRSMKDPNDLRPDDVYFYTLGQIDGDRAVEGYNERDNVDQTGDDSHLWHRHDSFRRNAVGNFWMMWKALTIDMGWTYAEWLRSTQPEPTPTPPKEEDLPVNQGDFNKLFQGALKDATIRADLGKALVEAKIGGDAVPDRTVGDALRDWVNGLRAVLWFPGDHKEAKPVKVEAGSPLEALLALPARVAEIERKLPDAPV